MMTVRDVMNRIESLEANLDRIENARRAGFDLNVKVGDIDATKREIDRLYRLEIGSAGEQMDVMEVMKAFVEVRNMVEDIVRMAYERVFGGREDE